MKVLSSQSPAVEVLDHVAAQPSGTPFSITSPTGQVLLFGARLSQSDILDPKILGQAGGLQLAGAWLPPLGLRAVPSVADLVARAQTSSQNRTSIEAMVARFTGAQNAQSGALAGLNSPIHGVIPLGGGQAKFFDGAVMPAQSKAFHPDNATNVAKSTGYVVNPFTDPKRASEVVSYVSDGVEMVAKLAPDLAGPFGIAGNILDGFAIITNGAGILDAIQKKDGKALAGYSLNIGVSAFALLGSFTGDPSYRNVAFVLKFVNSTVTISSNQNTK